jgi:hypothetical protein
MTQATLTASEIMLAWSLTKGRFTPSRAQVDAWSYSTTKAQMDARQVSADPTSELYYGTMLAGYRRIGWRVNDLGVYEHTPKPGVFATPAQLLVNGLRSVSDRWLGGASDPADMLEKLLDRLKNPPPHVRAFLDWYWNKTYVSATARHMGMGPLISILGVPYMLIGYFDFSVDAMNGWESMFQLYPSASIFARARLVNISLDMGVYETHKESLERELASVASEHIRSTTLHV